MNSPALFFCLLCACAAAAVGSAEREVAGATRSPRSPRSAYRRRQPSERAYDAAAASPPAPAAPAWPAAPWQPISLSIPIPRDAGSSVPLVILPVPVQAPGPQQTECRMSQHVKPIDEDESQDYYEPAPKPQPSKPERSRPAASSTSRPRTPPPAADDEDLAPGSALPPPQQPQAPPYPSYVTPQELDQTVKSPRLKSPFTSEQLVQLFREQAPAAPSLPPVLLSEHDRTERVLAEQPDALAAAEPAASAVPAPPAPLPPHPPHPPRAPPARPSAPPRPRFTRSLMMTGELTVPRADYTEPYTAWYDAGSGSSRVDLHGGATSTYRTFTADGRVQHFEMHVDRVGESPVRRCSRSDPRAAPPAAAADRRPPALPDLAQFTFAGYVERSESPEDGAGAAERWVRQVSGAAGELGAAPGERLTARHELLLARADADRALPIQYTVSVDSSVLGSDCEGYQHRYLDVRNVQMEPDFFQPNIEEVCDSLETLNSSVPEQLARLEPLREFTLPHRDPRYDAALQSFKSEHEREYADAREEAVRKAVLVQSARFSAAGNREGAPFRLGVNYLADRLGAELRLLQGAEQQPGDRDAAARFPHARRDLARAAPRLPDRFDWRPRGAVSPVQFQGATCASCWAFAVSGAVEGALFVRTRRLVPLSPQCLVDCAQPFGGKGCRGTWPSHAYEYVRARGLSAADQYTPYSEAEQRCREEQVPPVTRISGHVNVTQNSVTALKVAIKQHAPSVVLVDANHKSFVLYKEGVLYDDRCGKTLKKLKHAVLAVGWGSRKGEPHFVLKNSWSAAWGERGFVRVQARANTCGVLTRPSYPELARGDVLRRDLLDGS